MENNITLSIEQMQHLQDLGLDTSDASMWSLTIEGSDWPRPNCIKNGEQETEKFFIWRYTLQDIQEKFKDAFIYIWSDFETIHVETFDTELGGRPIHLESSDDMLLNAYNTLCWLLEQGYLKTKKE